MPIDASIYNAFAPRVQSPLEIQNGLMQQAQGRMALDAGALGLEERRNAIADRPRLQAQADEAHAAKLAEIKAKTDKDAADAARTKLETFQKATIERARQFSAADPNDNNAIANVMAGMKQAGLLTDEALAAEVQRAGEPGTPQRAAWYEQSKQMAQTQVERQQAQLDALKQRETAQHNRATEATAQGQLKVSQGQLGVAQGHLAVSRAAEGRAAAAPKGQIVQTDQGPMLVDPRDPASAKPITADGVPIKAPGPKVKDIPQQVVSGYVNNQTALKKIDDAIAALRANPDAVGVKNYAPDAIIQRVDQGGVKTRAVISDIGSLKIHDRTGAAMSAAESVRLNPFIPKATDSTETAIQKLQQMKAEYVDKNSGMESYYNNDMGFKPITDIAVPRTSSTAPASGGFKYIGPVK